MRFLKYLALAGALTLPIKAFANPVSFKDGWGIMPSYAPDWSDLQINYSLSNRDAVGVSTYFRRLDDREVTFGIGQYNYLFKRWNELDSQANIYGLIGVGGRHDSKDGDSLAGYGGLEADYETRHLYTLLSYETLQSPGGVDANRLRGRVGFSPYKAPIDKLNTWLILQTDYMPEMEEEVTVTPLLRLFYNNYALEAGVSLNGDPFLGAMAHF